MSVHLLGLVPLHITPLAQIMFFSFHVLTSECNDDVPITSRECGVSLCMVLGEWTPGSPLISHMMMISQPRETLDFIPLEEWCSHKYWLLFQNTVLYCFPSSFVFMLTLWGFPSNWDSFPTYCLSVHTHEDNSEWDHPLLPTGTARKACPEQIMSLPITRSSRLHPPSSDISTQGRKMNF